MNNIDVIISAYNWADALQKTLLGFTQQTYPYFRILIADHCCPGNNTMILI